MSVKKNAKAFKVGDKVVLSFPILPEDIAGKTGEIVRCDRVGRANLLVRFTDGSEDWCVDEELTPAAPTKPEAFKVGDRVRVKKDATGFFLGSEAAPRGCAGTVVESVYSSSDFVAVEFDKAFRYGHDCHGAAKPGRGHFVTCSSLEHVTNEPSKTTEGPFILILYKDGKYLPAAAPRVYKTREQAEKVACEMAKRHGGEFHLFKKDVAAVAVDKVVTKVEREVSLA